MKRSAAVCIILSGLLLALALFSCLYESRSTGLLPVITYPLRHYAIPLGVVGAVFGSRGVFIQQSKRQP